MAYTTLNQMTVHRDINPEEDQSLIDGICEFLQGVFKEDPALKQKVISMLSDPRNEDDFDTWTYGTEPLPGDSTWHSK